MNRKITAYLDVLFADIPKTKAAIELKAELTANLNDRMSDYLREGKSENQAYSLAIANMGDVDELLAGLSHGNTSVSVEDSARVKQYRTRNAVLKSVAVMLYILCPIPLFAISAVLPGYEEFGLIALLGMVAVATAFLVFMNASTPSELHSATLNNDDDDVDSFASAETNKKFKNFSSLVWSVATLIFFLTGFFLGQWGRIWVIFPIAGLSMSIIKTVLQLKEEF